MVNIRSLDCDVASSWVAVSRAGTRCSSCEAEEWLADELAEGSRTSVVVTLK